MCLPCRLPKEVVLDDVTALSALKDFAQTVDITSTDTFIRNNFLDVVGAVLCKFCAVY